MRKQPSKKRELLLLLFPVIAFAVWSVWLQFRRPFKLVVAEITVAIVPPNRAFGVAPGEKQVAVEIFLDHDGIRPLWWGRPVKMWRERVRFAAQGQRDDGSNIGSYAGPTYDQARGQYKFLFNGWVPDNPNYLKTATCHISTGLASDNSPSKQLAVTDDISISAAQFKVPDEIKTTMPKPPY